MDVKSFLEYKAEYGKIHQIGEAEYYNAPLDVKLALWLCTDDADSVCDTVDEDIFDMDKVLGDYMQSKCEREGLKLLPAPNGGAMLVKG